MPCLNNTTLNQGCGYLLCTASLAEENVLAATFEIAKAYDDLQLAHKKEVYCTIVTAQVRGPSGLRRR